MPGAFFIIAGPQCAGKTTTKGYLYSRYMTNARPQTEEAPPAHRNLILLPEMRQSVMHDHGIHSAIFINTETELEIVERDLARMDHLLGDGDDRIYLDETNVFTLAHALHRGLAVGGLISAYLQRLHALDAAILFLHVSPEVSWERRRARYQERVNGFPATQAVAVMDMYHDYLFALHKQLLEVSSVLGIELRSVDASGTVEATLSKAAEEFEQLADARKVRLIRRF